MSWRCMRVQQRLALFEGDDLPDRERKFVQSHLDRCSRCQAHLASLRRCRAALSSCKTEFDGACAPSLWPALQVHLNRPRVAGPQRWLPRAAMLAASIAIALVLWNRPAEFRDSDPVNSEYRLTKPPFAPSDTMAASSSPPVGSSPQRGNDLLWRIRPDQHGEHGVRGRDSFEQPAGVPRSPSREL